MPITPRWRSSGWRRSARPSAAARGSEQEGEAGRGKLIFAAIWLVVGWGLHSGLSRRRDLLPAALRSVVFTVVLLAAIVPPALILTFSVFRVIPAGEVGVKTLFGQVDPVPLREGLNVVWNPLYDVVVMDTRVLRHQARYDAASKDLQAVHVEMILNYRLVPERAPEVYRTIGLGYERVIVDPAAQEVLKANTAMHNAAEILVRRPAMKSDVQHDLTAWLTQYGIELKEASLANIRFDPAYEKAIEAKQIEAQKAEQKRYELVQAQREAEIMAAQAKGKGDAAREEVRGVAEALRLKGEAEAAYNAKVAASLTPSLIQQQYLARWDGRLPQYTIGGGTTPLIQIPSPPGDGSRR